jgi:hypothetical protein
MEGEGPKRSVEWADTEDFINAFGKTAASEEIAKFKRQVIDQRPPTPFSNEKLDQNHALGLLFLWLGGVALGATLTYFLVRRTA